MDRAALWISILETLETEIAEGRAFSCSICQPASSTQATADQLCEPVRSSVGDFSPIPFPVRRASAVLANYVITFGEFKKVFNVRLSFSTRL